MIADAHAPLPQASKVTPAAWLFVACCAVRCVLLWRGLPLDEWPDLILALWADILILAVLARRLPPQNWLSLALLIYSLGGLVEGHLVHRFFLFGFPLVWIGILLGARELGRLLLRAWRQSWGYGFWLAGFASILSGVTLTGTSLLIHSTNHVLQALVWRTVAAAVILILSTLVIISKRPTAEVLEKNPLAIWMGFILVLGAAAAAKFL